MPRSLVNRSSTLPTAIMDRHFSGTATSHTTTGVIHGSAVATIYTVQTGPRINAMAISHTVRTGLHIDVAEISYTGLMARHVSASALTLIAIKGLETRTIPNRLCERERRQRRS